jgi:hypothetical protein
LTLALRVAEVGARTAVGEVVVPVLPEDVVVALLSVEAVVPVAPDPVLDVGQHVVLLGVDVSVVGKVVEDDIHLLGPPRVADGVAARPTTDQVGTLPSIEEVPALPAVELVLPGAAADAVVPAQAIISTKPQRCSWCSWSRIWWRMVAAPMIMAMNPCLRRTGGCVDDQGGHRAAMPVMSLVSGDPQAGG